MFRTDLLRDYGKETFQTFDRVQRGHGVTNFTKYYKRPDKRLTDDDIDRAMQLFKGNKDHLEFLTAIQPTIRNIVTILRDIDYDQPDNM